MVFGIRKMIVEDEDDIMKLVEVLYKGRLMMEADWGVNFGDKRKSSFVCEEDGLVVGYVYFEVREDAIHVGDLFVSEGFRNCGAGLMLLERVFEVGREKGIMIMKIDVRKENRDARRLYLRFGFEDIEEDEEFCFMGKVVGEVM